MVFLPLLLSSAVLAQPAAAAPSTSTTPVAALDFEFFRTRVEPIFLKKRDGHARCYTCHRSRAQFHLQTLSPGAETWSEEQSRQNFAVARRLTVPGNPEKSRLLEMPLAEEAGGTAFHPGGKHFDSREDPEWKTLAEWVRGTSSASTAAGLDFEAYRDEVEPIFLNKRDGHARCYVCHSRGTGMRLERLAEGATSWTEEQSRRNFQAVRRMVVREDPMASRLLTMPLSEDAGGTPFHPGGKHWESRDAREFQTLLHWVQGRR